MTRKALLALTAVSVLLLGVQIVTRIKQPVAAGPMYPKDPGPLKAKLDELISAASIEDAPEGRPVALVVPNGPYGLAGGVAAHAFKLIRPGQYERIIILTASHFATFRGASIASVQFYRTPLGDVPLDWPAVQKLSWSTLVSTRGLQDEGPKGRPILHEREYGVEVLLPFLQQRAVQFKLVPIVLGELKSYSGALDKNALSALARNLEELVTERTLIIVSTNLTHYGNAYSFRPFKEDVMEGVKQLDTEAITLILRRDADGFWNYLGRTGNAIDGKLALMLLFKLLPASTSACLLDYRNSAFDTGDTTNCVSYAAMAFIDPSKPPLPQQPVYSAPEVELEAEIEVREAP